MENQYNQNIPKKSISKLEYKIVSQLQEGAYKLKVEFFKDSLKIKIDGGLYKINLDTKNNIKFISSLSKALTDLHIENWEDAYVISNTLFITDLPRWKLKIKYSNSEVKEISGYGAYPKNWEDFNRVINEYSETAINSVLKKLKNKA